MSFFFNKFVVQREYSIIYLCMESFSVCKPGKLEAPYSYQPPAVQIDFLSVGKLLVYVISASVIHQNAEKNYHKYLIAA